MNKKADFGKVNIIAIDWSHTKDLATFDGRKLRVEEKKTLINRLIKLDGEEESKNLVKSSLDLHSPTVVLEQGCPLSLVYAIAKIGLEVKLISNRATQDYRVEHNTDKTDENDARIIWELAQSGVKLSPISLSDNQLTMYSLYHQYCRYQKARVALMNQKKAHLRHYGDADMLPYDIAIDSLKAKESSIMKQLGNLTKGVNLLISGDESNLQIKSTASLQSPDTKDPLMLGGKSRTTIKSSGFFQPPGIKGLGERLWVGILMTANPINFKCLSAYLRFCGLTSDVIKSHKYNRHAKMLYHLLAEEIVKQRDPKFRPLYDKLKEDMAIKYEGETKARINNAALNRVATFLAKNLYRYVLGLAGRNLPAQ